MKIFPFFNELGQSNSYVVELSNQKDAIIIDCGGFSIQQIELIEDNKYNILGVFITHCHLNHTMALSKLLKIYTHINVYSFVPFFSHGNTIKLNDNDIIELGNSVIEVFALPGHSQDSLVFKIENALFTGDVLASGRIGSTKSNKDKLILVDGIKKRLMTLDDSCLIFPGHGAVSKVRVEKMFNHDLLDSVVTLSNL